MIGSKLDIFKKEWLDVVFEGRNKEYGAYELRKLAPKATNTGLFIVVIVSLLLTSLKVLNIQFSTPAPPPEPVAITEVTLEDLEEIEPPPVEEEEPLPAEEKPQQIAQEPPAEDLIRFPEPKVVPNNQVKEEVASQEDFKDDKKSPARITLKGKPGSTGVPTGEFGPKKVDGQITGVEKGDPNVASNEIFTAVEVNPEPPGGMKAFMGWVGSNYSYPNAALEQGVNGVVEVAFVVEKDGSLTDINVKRDLSYGTGQAAVALLKKAKKWKPGIQNGRPVRVAYTLPIRLNTINQ
ncbi:TonB family protein [Sphingobacteriaceae bacterium WQ 2009]|uniref:TonB family protein n=1 Tax=Rhinopithecimicrobium faecis TaxID=2820698 RepID=A0A8T4HAN7_9SPHI|nr:TonB family protein [Sphingobacteriaceae bacterium WQ 2009]